MRVEIHAASGRPGQARPYRRDSANRLARIVQRLTAFFARPRQQQARHLRRQQRIGQRAVTIVNRQVEGDGDPVEASAAHPGQITAGQRDGVYPFKWEVDIESGVLRFVAEEAKSNPILCRKIGSVIDELVRLWQYLSGAARPLDHRLADAGKAGDELGNTAAGVDESLKMRARLAVE